ncbi:type VI secretion system baseplate subunit TssE [Bradyrhizobium sp. ISRA443]|uniref:type VI secretion system baseplate subunit TssE n=1 Tax=unclassified Bradyrhizobium TaxID=2631580 RepID=UPI002478EF5A|nr:MULTISPECIES: type VI secretion system baseplate subunit TssE [unclassified Bradyrhizobium]WGR97046.1 type VI secretion system baseplate subunit TssE [Bradyrhizobium sp. ISRA436]WGS03934.1 type VI secretion system baseplate subunit TssE [Bradyrhizobium sp. ISRA437]WGS10817.1 type VI secretion system baseplate subunit TssE [Bradyrhizobium sp. ISRA443]
MTITPKRDRLCPPLMQAFRSAHEARDARKKLNLRDESGERVIAGRRSAGRFPISETLLRREVSHDLEMLLNTIALESTLNLSVRDCVRTSILNYGFPDIAHRSIDEVTDDELTDALRVTLTTYEPRLDRKTIRVRRDGSVGPEQLKLRFVVHADLKVEPLNVPVEFVADVDLDSGDIQINRL